MRLFAYRLALALGQPDVDAMLAGLTTRQFLGWQHYAAVEPFGEERADLRAGIISATIANVFAGKSRSFKPADFMPRFTRPVRQTARQIYGILRAMF